MSERIITMTGTELINTMKKHRKAFTWSVAHIYPTEISAPVFVNIQFFGEDKTLPFCEYNFNEDFYNTYLKQLFNKPKSKGE